MKKLLFFLLLTHSLQLKSQESGITNHSLTYDELIAEYQRLDKQFESASLIPYGKTDCGESLQLFVISANGINQPKQIHEQNKIVLFINNGIHPGEPDGMDASLRFAKDLLYKEKYRDLLKNVVVCIIPAFNIDGALERNSNSRVNQDGPAEYGFRGNAKNLDLNRDFIKTDALNTRSLKMILHQWDPDVFVDTHVSDGADYQYTMTLISSQHSKASPPIGTYMKDIFTPSLFNSMKAKNDEMTPYVSTLVEEGVPDSGIVAFLETPRFGSGYVTLLNSFSFITETHMLKPFPERVNSTQRFLHSLISICDEKKDAIINARKKAFEYDLDMKTFPLNYEVDLSKKDELLFKGYECNFEKSKVTTGMRLKYDHKKPYEKVIPFYNYYEPKDSILIPRYFYIPQAWENIIRMLDANGVKSTRITQDSISRATTLYIKDYKTTGSAFEGHYLHYKTQTESKLENNKFKKGDYLIDCKQKHIRILLETLMPSAEDSYFNWGFFDSILQQKEWFSAYVFEEIAEKLLAENSQLKSDFVKWQSEHPNEDEYSQLYFVYSHSDYFEKSFKRYPVRLIYSN